MMAKWRQTLRRFGHWLTSRKRALPAIKFFETRLPEAKRDWSIRETIIDVSRGVRTRNPLSATAIISGTLPTRTKQDDRMSNDLLANYKLVGIHEARIGKRAQPKYIATGRNLLSRLFSGSAMLKVLRSLRAETSRIPSIQLSLSALRFVLFLMRHSPAKNSKSSATFFLFRAMRIVESGDTSIIIKWVLSKTTMANNMHSYTSTRRA